MVLAVGDVKLDVPQSRAFQLIGPGIITLVLGRGTGKSFLDRLCIHRFALERPGIHIGLLLPSLKQARQVFWPELFEDFAYLEKAGYLDGPPNKSLLEVRYANGSRLTTWGAENAHAIRGQRFGMLVEDEADDVEPSVEKAVVEPTFSKSGVNAIWLKSGTPRRGMYGGLYRDHKLAKEGSPGYRTIVVPSADSSHVDQTWLARVKATTDPKVFAREYEVSFTSAEGLVYDLFDPDFHVKTPPPGVRFHECVIGADWGTLDPSVLLLIGIQGHGEDAIAWIIDEQYEPGVSISDWDKRAKIWHDQYRPKYWPDPSRPDRIQNWRTMGLDVGKADNDIAAGVSRVSDLLFRRTLPGIPGEFARLYVHPKCKKTIWEFQNYRRKQDPKNPDEYLEDIIDKNNHAMDSLRYAMLGRFGRLPTVRTVVPAHS